MTEEDIEAIALKRYCSPYGNPNGETFAFIEGYKEALKSKKMENITAESISQWVIDNRYPKSEYEKLTDLELYHELKEKVLAAMKEIAELAFGAGFEYGNECGSDIGNPDEYPNEEQFINQYFPE